jgi:hypothetical protein
MTQLADSRVWVRVGLAVALLASAASATACHRPATVATAPPREVRARGGFAVDALFVAAELRFDGKKVVTHYDAGEDGASGTSETETRWTVTCTQAPRRGTADRRVAELTCASENADGEPFPMSLDGYWIATPAGVWHTSSEDDPLEPVERLLSLPPAARSDELPDPEADPERDPPAREVYATREVVGGAWCHERISDPGGGAEASTWSLCLDARGLVSGSSSDGHGAVVWETSFTRR